MAGFCGVAGDAPAAPDEIAGHLALTGAETTATGRAGDATVTAVVHDPAAADPATAADGTTFWVWGDVHGDGAPGAEPPAPVVARRYDASGFAGLADVRGEFAGVAAGPGGALALFTDRLGTRPLYHAPAADGLVFATNVAAVACHPAVETAYDPALLGEFFATRRVFGTATPFEGVRQLPPATHLRVGPDGSRTATTRWRPEPRPAALSFDAVLDEFCETLDAVVRERTAPDGHYGVLLSGGGDSRLVLDALVRADRTVTAYHLNEWHNREARVAARVAEVAGVEFAFLRRDRTFVPRSLARIAPHGNFTSGFQRGCFAAFADELGDVDALLTGDMVNTLFDAAPLPTRRLHTPLGKVELPFAEPVASLADYVETLAPDPPAYFAGPSPRATLAARLARRADGGVDSHGVAYPSFRAFLEHHELYPFTNHRNYLFYGELCHVAPHFTPFLDRRFVDLSLRTPRRHKLRRNVVDRALARVAPDLAAVPHANRSVPLDWPFPAQWVGYHLTGLYRKLPVRGGEPHFSRGPWPDHPALLRADPFVDDLLAADGDALDRAPFLDRAGARRCLRAHRDGANEHDALYALAVFLGHPATARLLGPDAMGSS